jgi:hypothetical protein
MSHRPKLPLALGALSVLFTAAGASAQVGTGATWTTGQPATGWTTGGYGAPAAQPSSSRTATDIELGALYVFSAGFGAGTGIWIDAEAGISDPGLQFVAPAILGLAGPVGVFFLNRPTMPRGMPAAIAAGMAIGAGEGAGIASYQFVVSKEASAWGFKGLARSVFIGSVAGTAAGFATGYYMEPSPKQSLLIGSGVAWGTVAGTLFGFGASTAHSDWGDANDAAALGGLIGYNVGAVGAAALSMVWVPSYQSLAWMWAGYGIGAAVSLPVYIFYAGGEHDPRRGLIFQGTAAMLGLAAGAVLTMDSKDSARAGEGTLARADAAPAALTVTGVGMMPVKSGLGFQVSGVLF